MAMGVHASVMMGGEHVGEADVLNMGCDGIENGGGSGFGIESMSEAEINGQVQLARYHR